MRVLIVTDTHGALRVSDFPEETYFDLPDAIFILGDVYKNDIALTKKLYPTVKMMGVGGNHDPWDLLTEMGVEDLHERVIKWRGLYIAGFGGSFKYKDSEYYMMHTQEEASKAMARMYECDLLLTHDQPCFKPTHIVKKMVPVEKEQNKIAQILKIKPGTLYQEIEVEEPIEFDTHTGLVGIAEYIDKNHPKLHLHGHLHDVGTDWHGTTCIRRFYGVELIEIDL